MMGSVLEIDVLCVGHASYDLIFRLPALTNLAEITFALEQVKRNPTC